MDVGGLGEGMYWGGYEGGKDEGGCAAISEGECEAMSGGGYEGGENEGAYGGLYEVAEYGGGGRMGGHDGTEGSPGVSARGAETSGK